VEFVVVVVPIANNIVRLCGHPGLAVVVVVAAASTTIIAATTKDGTLRTASMTITTAMVIAVTIAIFVFGRRFVRFPLGLALHVVLNLVQRGVVRSF
jgi:hypothetical protein